MKNKSCFIIAYMLIAFTATQAQTNTFPATGSAGIGTTVPHASSALEINSTTQGILISRMTKTQRDAIPAPATGLIIYQTTNAAGFYYYNGTSWIAVKTKAWFLTGNANTVAGTHFIGTTDAQPLMFKINNTKSGYLDFDSEVANTGFGYQTLFSITGGYNNTAIGYKSLYSNTTGYWNTANGGSALYSNTTGSNNTANGYGALYSTSDGYANTAVGVFALYAHTSGDYNTANGGYALTSNTTGDASTASGYGALFHNNTGFNNSANGYESLYYNTTGNYNTANGHTALFSNTTGSSNTANGFYALSSNTTGTNNTALGYSANVSTGSLTNATAIGNATTVDASNKVRIGNSSVSSNGGQVSWSTYSDGRIKNDVKENVPGLEFINKLRPVTFHYDVKKENDLLVVKDSQNWEGKYDIEKIQFSGFIAQEVNEAALNIGFDFSGVDKSGKVLSLRYSDFVVPMVKAMQELDENQKSEVDELKKEIEDLKSRIASLQSSGESQSSMNDGFVKLQTSDDQSQIILGQNLPNPFDNSTLIPFRIPKDCKDASIMITNSADSEVISVIPISCNEDHLRIEAGFLASGTYSYSLYIDGTVIQTKKMTIVK